MLPESQFTPEHLIRDHRMGNGYGYPKEGDRHNHRSPQPLRPIPNPFAHIQSQIS
jgi:hypothetical protein